MDEGSPSQLVTPPIMRYFDVSEGGFAWRDPRLEQIRERRAAMDDKLIFDTLMISGGIRDPDFVYPPHDVAGLKRLLDAIERSNYDTLKKQTLVYFLLKWHQDGREEQYRELCCIPPQFSALADAYWHLDSGINIGRAISILSDSRLNRDYASKIIQALSLSPGSAPLLRKYVRTVNPPLVEPPDLLRYIVALAESSFSEAWHFQRTIAETDGLRPRLFRKLLDWSTSSQPQPKALKTLISLPLSKYEEGLLNDYALKTPEDFSPAATARLQDLVCVRYIELGKYADAIKMDRKFSATAFDGKESSERRTMIRELYEALPPVEKSLIDMPIQDEKKKKKPQLPSNSDIGMSQSWEEVRVPESLSKSTSTPLRNIQIPTSTSLSAAPRFTVATSASGPSASSITAPILPLSTNPAQAQPQTFTPRKTFQGNPLSSSLLGKGHSPLSGAGKRLALGALGVSSPASGIRFPLHAATKSAGPASHASAETPAPTPPTEASASAAATAPAPVFKKTTNQANAFFQPKVAANTTKRVFGEVEQSPERVESRAESRGATDADEQMEVEERPTETQSKKKESNAVQDSIPGWRNGVHDDEALDQSIFAPQEQSSKRPTRTQNASASHGRTTTSSRAQERPAKAAKTRQQPPGAFAADDDEEDGHESQSEEEEVISPPQRRRTTQQARTSAPTRTAKETKAAGKQPATTRGRGRKSKGDQLDENLGRSIPGSLFAEDDHDADEHTDGEEEDQVAPLRQPSPTTAKRPVRKARSLASTTSEVGDDDGPATRRRSSRLTATTSLRNLSPESVKGESVTAPKPAKKSRTSTATKKRK